MRPYQPNVIRWTFGSEKLIEIIKSSIVSNHFWNNAHLNPDAMFSLGFNLVLFLTLPQQYLHCVWLESRLRPWHRISSGSLLSLQTILLFTVLSFCRLAIFYLWSLGVSGLLIGFLLFPWVAFFWSFGQSNSLLIYQFIRKQFIEI